MMRCLTLALNWSSRMAMNLAVRVSFGEDEDDEEEAAGAEAAVCMKVSATI
jgi:hypothetical protein